MCIRDSYYLVAYDHTASPPGIRHYRVDKMANLSVLEESRLGKATFDGFDMAQYANCLLYTSALICRRPESMSLKACFEKPARFATAFCMKPLSLMIVLMFIRIIASHSTVYHLVV